MARTKIGVSQFHFKQFSVFHEKSAMKVGTDAVLLGAWAFRNEVALNGRGLDVGCGCGVMALMMAQRFPKMIWQGIELHAAAFEEAKQNVSNSPFSHRVNIVQGDFLSEPITPQWDMVICNPPFYQNTLSSADEARNMARQERFLMPELFLEKVWQVTFASGRLAAVLPLDRKEFWKNAAQLVGWKLNRECAVKGHAEIQANRYLLEWSKVPITKVEIHELILEESRGMRSAAYQDLTQDFYL